MDVSPADSFRVRRRSEAERVVQVYGELDMASGPRLEDALGAVGVPPVTDLELDLSGVRLVDAYAMRCLQRAARKVADRGCTLHLSALQPNVRAVLLLVGFDGVVPIDPPDGPATATWGRRPHARPA